MYVLQVRRSQFHKSHPQFAYGYVAPMHWPSSAPFVSQLRRNRPGASGIGNLDIQRAGFKTVPALVRPHFFLHMVSSDFAPGYTNWCQFWVTNFAAWCLRVLPTCYDSSLRAEAQTQVTHLHAYSVLMFTLVCLQPLVFALVSAEHLSARSSSLSGLLQRHDNFAHGT